MTPTAPIAVGDIITQPSEGGGWSVLKILAIDTFPDGFSTAHCLAYNDAPYKPSLASLPTLGVRIWHAPIAAESLASGREWLGNEAPSEEELAGFVEYLKLTDFPRYVAFTGQNTQDIVSQATQHYRRAYQLEDEGRKEDAIVEYTTAIELFPLFYEAIDNRAFVHMDLGRYQEALWGFEQSLEVNPNGGSAFFSKGECLLRLGHLDAAEAIFAQGLTRFPEKQPMFQEYLQLTQNIRRQRQSEAQ